MPKIVTANNLATGMVVFLGEGDRWVASVADARLYADAAAAENGLAVGQRDAAKAIIVDPFVTDKGDGAEATAGMTMRDRIRALGPTIVYGPAAAPKGRRDSAEG